jgi:hypothetical protein
MFLKTENKMLQIGIAYGACAFILIGLYFFPGRSIFKYKGGLEAQFQTDQSRLIETRDLVRSFADPQKAIEDMEKKAKVLREMGITARQLPKIIQSLALPATQLGANIISIRPREDIKIGEENLPSGISKLHIEIVLRCHYRVLADYLKALRQLPTTFTVMRLILEKRQEPVSEGEKISDKTKEAPELFVTSLVSTYLVREI